MELLNLLSQNTSTLTIFMQRIKLSSQNINSYLNKSVLIKLIKNKILVKESHHLVDSYKEI
jgi:hypothetical protein